jgi:hypothetical protein
MSLLQHSRDSFFDDGLDFGRGARLSVDIDHDGPLGTADDEALVIRGEDEA